MNEPITIPKELPKDTALSYDFLREEGIKIIQELSGNSWTDHNIHDPGITILEQVCYAITDVAYRLDYDIKDLLGNKEDSYKELYSPATILTTSPVTLLDYRKVIIDTKGVRNAWIEKVSKNLTTTVFTDEEYALKGLYKVIIEKDDSENGAINLVKEVKEKLQALRGLCEDFDEIILLNKQKIRFGGTIEISDSSDDINQLIAEILYSLHWSLSPAVPFYTLPELRAKGKRIDEIFEGPTLTHGFIDSEELLKSNRKQEVHASDMIKEIMDVSNVVTVQNFFIASGTDHIKYWVFSLDKTKTPSLDVVNTLDAFTFKVSGLEASINKDLILELYETKINEFIRKKTLRIEEKDITISVGEDREIENYYSIQEQFPLNFGIGSVGLPESSSEKRKAQSKQLAAYLTFFDQLLANYFSQVSNFNQLIGFSSTNYTTLFNQSLLGKVPELENILQDEESYSRYLSDASGKNLENLQRKNQFLNHLLARYSEKFTAYGMLVQNADETAIDHEEKLIKDKIEFLKEYPILSSQRGKGFDYTLENVKEQKSGLEKRIIKKLGIESSEDFYMVEHLLLRPNSSEKSTFETYYKKNEITTVEASDISNNTKCNSLSFSLSVDEQIAVYDHKIRLGVFKITKVVATGFEIDLAFEKLTEASKISWQRVDPDIRYHVFTDAITSFEASSNTNTTFCKANHQLKVADEVKIEGTNVYNGVYTVLSISEEGFEIQIPFNENETKGRFSNTQKHIDTYSLQVTFMLPKGKGRYQNPVFKNLIENTIREETPVHITTYAKWLDEVTMTGFKKSYQTFLAEIK